MFLRISVELGDLRPRQPRSIVFGRFEEEKNCSSFVALKNIMVDHQSPNEHDHENSIYIYIYTYVTYCNTYIVIIILKQIEY